MLLVRKEGKERSQSLDEQLNSLWDLSQLYSMVSCHFTMLHKSISVVEYFPSSDSTSHTPYGMFIAPSGKSSRWTEVQKPVSFFGVNFPTAQCICFASALHSLLFPVNLVILVLSHC